MPPRRPTLAAALVLLCAGGALLQPAGSQSVRSPPRCFGAKGDWCNMYHLQPLLPAVASAPPLHGKRCPSQCSGTGVCNADTGLCDCPAGAGTVNSQDSMQSTRSAVSGVGHIAGSRGAEAPGQPESQVQPVAPHCAPSRPARRRRPRSHRRAARAASPPRLQAGAAPTARRPTSGRAPTATAPATPPARPATSDQTART